MITSDFQTFLSNALGVAVVRNSQSKKRPKRPYATWGIITQVRQGQRENGTSGSGVSVNETTSLVYVYNIELNIYTTADREENSGKLARERLNDFLLYLSTSQGIEDVSGLDFKIMNHTDYENMDAYLGSEWERRAIAELNVLSRESVETAIDSIDPASVEGSIIINFNT